MALFQLQYRLNALVSLFVVCPLVLACDHLPEEATPEETFDIRSTGSALTDSVEAPVVDNLRREFPGARLKMRGSRVKFIDGTTLTAGDTPEQSAEALKAAMLRAHRAGPKDLVPHRVVIGGREVLSEPEPVGVMYDRKNDTYKFWLFRYGQQVHGIPVHDAELLVLVRNKPGYPVALATSSMRNVSRFAPRATPRALEVDRAGSLEAARADANRKARSDAPSKLDVFSKPELVVFAGDGEAVASPRLAMRYTGETARGLNQWRFIADASTGEILNTEDRVHSVNVWGRVRGNVTVEPVAADCAPELSVPLPWAEVSIPGVSEGFTGAQGFYVLRNPDTAPLEVVSTLHGKYIDVWNYLGDNESLSQTVTPPGPSFFLHNQADNHEHVIAQANAYYHVNLARSVLLYYAPDFPVISDEEDFWVSVNGDETFRGGFVCPADARYINGYIVFCESGDGWRNTAFGTIAYHEYGHHVVEAGGSSQGTYGEGFSDALAAMISGDPREGLGYLQNDCTSFLRTSDNNCRFDPVDCTTNCGDFSDLHGCGRLFSGIIWDLREALMASHPTDYEDILYPLLFEQVQNHAGSDLINEDILTVMLALDDDDGNPDNGTPHSAEICSAFEAHGIDCPDTGTRPCDGICSNPVVFGWSGSYQSGDLQTGAVCRETTQDITGGNCGNFASPRTLSVNGAVMTCNNQPWPGVPPKRNGGYCISTTAGDYPYAFFTLW